MPDASAWRSSSEDEPMANTSVTNADGGWVQTMVGAISAIVITGGSMYTVIISPMQTRIDRLESGREKDHDQLAVLYTSIQTNDEYKKTIKRELDWARSDIERVQHQANALDEVHKQRAGQAAEISDLKARWERLDRHNEEQDRRNSPTILEDVKTLRIELESLRQRIMIPLGTGPAAH
jgi:predicted RNase H-like nuclease (RuvC/YqgF family)